MSITDGLRRYAANWDGFFYDDEDGRLINAIGYVPARSTPVPNVINAIADSIDKQHAEERDKAYNKGVNDGIDADKNAMGYIKLPVDADGVPWHLGDKVDGMVGSITCLSLGCIGWTFRIGDAYTFQCERYRHYHEPTVDDLLFSFGQACIRASNEAETDAAKQTMLANLRHEYAEKLHLAGETE